LLSQSAVSQQIRRLEEELGVEVFRRTSRSVALTPEGQVILGYAKRVLAELDGMHGELEEISGLLSGELRIGGVYPTGPFDLVGCQGDDDRPLCARERITQRVRVHGDGRRARPGEQGPRWPSCPAATATSGDVRSESRGCSPRSAQPGPLCATCARGSVWTPAGVGPGAADRRAACAVASFEAQAEVRHLRAISMVQIASDAAFDPTEGSPTRSRGSQSGVGTRAHFDADSGRYRRSSWALAIASLLEWTPSLRRMCLMWLCTVSSETTSSFEIS
jgi:Bacterial regulatory helix-turn-helix protein, lysR family